MEAAAWLSSTGWRNGFHHMEPWDTAHWDMPRGLHGYLEKVEEEDAMEAKQDMTLSGDLEAFRNRVSNFLFSTPVFAQGGANREPGSGIFQSGMAVFQMQKLLRQQQQQPQSQPEYVPEPLTTAANSVMPGNFGSQTLGSKGLPTSGLENFLVQQIRW